MNSKPHIIYAHCPDNGNKDRNARNLILFSHSF
uniref:Uncharacterized protein n=1 Tax=Rhizophora mucronata TaxID=61149 RepID=A0A2P2R0Y7_RHIMU